MQVTFKGVTLASLLMVSAAHAFAFGGDQLPPQQPPAGGGRRESAAERDARRTVPVGTGSIAGRVVAADTGRPVKRARVVVAGGAVGGGGARPYMATTDDQGRYKVNALPAGTYSVTATKTGFVDAAFGQRSALRAGTPIDLTDGRQLPSVDLKLPRGGVVTGHVLDEDGEPLARAVVTVLRQQYTRGEKQLSPAGSDQSDDRGQFRVFGLPPGDYYVSAAAGAVERILRQLVDPGGAAIDQPESIGYAATYYPGVTSAGEATRVKLAAAQELSGLDFQIQVVSLATVKGIVVGGASTVMLMPQDGGAMGAGRGDGGGGRGAIAGLLGGQGLRTTTRPDGTFSIANVTPGKYTIVARTDAFGSPRTAVQPLTVVGEEVSVALTPAPGVQLSGAITLESSAAATATAFAGFRVNPLPLDSAVPMPRMARPADVQDNGQFAINDVMAGRYSLRATGPRGWMMKAIFMDGRDVTDQPIEIRSENVSGLNVIFTDRISSLSGAVRDSRGTPLAGLTIVVFPSDDKLWTPQSRQILTARTDTAGAYSFAALPEGDYLVIAADDVEPGEWFDPAFLEQRKGDATKLKLVEGEKKTQDLKAPASSDLPSAPSAS